MNSRAIFTIVKNEAKMLPLWLKYYSNHFFESSIYILNHQSDDGSIGAIQKVHPSVRITTVKNEFAHDHEWLRQTVMEFQKTLLERYKLVMFTEVDELIVHKTMLLKNYIDMVISSEINCVACCGYEIFHDPNKEPEIDFNAPIMKQRNYWFRRNGAVGGMSFDKPLISKIPLGWAHGFHAARECAARDDDLVLVHLHRVDYRYCIDRHEWRASIKAKHDGMGYHNYLTGKKLEDFYFSPASHIEEIPKWVKTKF